ncbi:hypothetical protein KP509_24G079800 [Ceratopteris richardii]|uniref:EIPR1-like beta-propeller domain-containing protein n=1 Tax=Ceratopteris richardii TaxID=49495 RepID=A0A8T2RWS1_CERRI|nr:hypothetical protein KP509_24G079800 [Ceratopteris richardii]
MHLDGCGGYTTNSFLVGTLSLREQNEVHLIKYSANTGDVACEGLYSHAQEIWDLASCPFDPLIFSTAYASTGDFGALVWRISEHSKRTNQLEKLAYLSGHTKRIKCIDWAPNRREHSKLLSIDEEALYVWDLDVNGSLL